MKAMTQYDYEHTQGIPIRMDEDADRDLAAEARHGGRYITHALAKNLQGWDPNPGLRAAFAGEHGPEALAEIWRFTASPSGAVYGTSGRDTTAHMAQEDACNGGVEWPHKAYWLAPTLPESAFDWPIYSAATISPATILDALRTTEAEYNVVFEDKAARGRFLEGMSIAQRIYRGAMNALADGRSTDG